MLFSVAKIVYFPEVLKYSFACFHTRMINEFRGMRDMDEEEGEEEAVDVFIQK